MSLTDLDKAVSLIAKHRNSITQQGKGSGSALVNIIQFTNKADEIGLNMKSAMVLCFIEENGSATIEQLKLAGIASTHNGSIGSMLRGCKFNQDELIVKENSGNRDVGRLYKLTGKGRELALCLSNTLLPSSG